MTSYDAASTMYLAPRSGATLIITPPTLMGQWERELREKHVDGPRLRILKVRGQGAAEW